MQIPRSAPKNKEHQSMSAMRISLLYKRFLRLGLLALAAAWLCWLSTPRATAVEAEAAPAAQRPPMFVLQVGIGKYQHTPTWAELRGAVTDVVEMRKVLEGDRWNIPAANILTITDTEGTKRNIFEKFQSHLIANAEKYYQKTKDRRKGAIILFQFSGHGSQVPDLDGDEKDDGKDETLVTVDSQDAPGKNFDITDDEIYALTSRLRPFTDNIVYVFDSCHSGSGTRDSGDVRRLPEKKTPVVTIPGILPSTRSGGVEKPADSESGVLPPGDDYIVITAAHANQLASQRNCFEECGQTQRPVVYGYLTYYLIDELKNARNDTSYRELMENVSRRLSAEKPTQTPQLEGDSSRFVFGALGRTEDSFVRVLEAETKKPNGERLVKIATGAMQGVTVGTLVSFYDSSVTKFDAAEKVTSGSVIAVAPAASTVRLNLASRDISVGDKSLIVAADLGSLRLKLNLDADTAKLTAPEKEMIGKLRAALTPAAETSGLREVDLVGKPAAAAGSWDVAVLKDKYETVAAKIGGGRPACRLPGPEPETVTADIPAGSDVFYLAAKDYVPLYGVCLYMPSGTQQEQNEAVRRLATAAVHLARLKSVNAIANRRSLLNGKVSVRPVRMSGPFSCENSKFVAGSSEVVARDPKTGYYKLVPGDVFWLEVTNNSPRDLYIVLLNMPPDGGVLVKSPRNILGENKGIVVAANGGKRIVMSDACRADSGGNFLEAGAMRVSKTTGLDRFKLIVSTDLLLRESFESLQMGPLTTQRKEVPSMAGKKDWTTVETILEIADTGK
ncbi:MAG TPA: caspase family protein [Pyrinomonadaceae bacterium]|nr:caspase family protein [Pyrinomonadaceae bacterium]